MAYLNRALRWLGLLLVIVVSSSSADVATVGLAEWEVYTPGGHLISHIDGWKEKHGDCLRSSDAFGPERVFVEHLQRWRYHADHVVGESSMGFFIFNERTRQVHTFADESEMLRAIVESDLGDPHTDWLTAVDGWREAWFLYMVWRPCKGLLEGERGPETSLLSREDCEEALAPGKLRMYRKTTWGRYCDGREPDRSSEVVDTFCEELNEVR